MNKNECIEMRKVACPHFSIGTAFWLNPIDLLALNSLEWRYKIELKERFWMMYEWYKGSE